MKLANSDQNMNTIDDQFVIFDNSFPHFINQ